MALTTFPKAFEVILKNLQEIEIWTLGSGGGTNINILVAFIFPPDFLLCFSNALQIALIAVLGGFEVILKNLQTNCNL